MPRDSGRDWFVCPVCGEEVAADALACPGCGSDDRTGWSAETEYDGVDLSEPDEKPAENVVWRDSAEGRPAAGIPAWMLVTAALLLALFVLLALAGAF